MAYPFSLPENMIVMQGAPSQVGSGADVDSRAISMKNILKLWILVDLEPAAAAYTLTPQTDALVAFGSAAVLTNAVPIWFSADADTTTGLTRATDAVNYATAADTNPKLTVFEIDPARMTAGEKAIRMHIPALAVGDYACVTYIVLPRYAGVTEADLTVD